MACYLSSGKGFGKISEPCSTCEPEYNIYDEQNKLRWVVLAKCCQSGIVCNNRCGKCSEVLFTIHKPDDIIKDRKNCSGYISKKFAGCLKEMFNDENCFELIFPVEATNVERLLLISTVLMIDYKLYDDENNNKEAIV
jgi:hypothetical protein